MGEPSLDMGTFGWISMENKPVWTKALRSIERSQMIHEHLVHSIRLPPRFIVREVGERVFKAEPLPLFELPDLNLFAESMRQTQEEIAKLYGVPERLIRGQEVATFENNREANRRFYIDDVVDTHLMDSFRYAMQNAMSNLNIQMLYGTWDVEENEDEWKEEYREGEQHKTFPL